MTHLFAEYQVVEGEIEEGDIVLERLTTGEYEPFEIHDKNEIDKENMRKMALFLCTEKIEIGKLGTRLNVVPFVQVEGEPSHYQVLGRISHDAKWVRRKDRFEESDIQYLLSLQPPYEGYEQATLEEYELWTGLKTIKIKGPCNHFH